MKKELSKVLGSFFEQYYVQMSFLLVIVTEIVPFIDDFLCA